MTQMPSRPNQSEYNNTMLNCFELVFGVSFLSHPPFRENMSENSDMVLFSSIWLQGVFPLYLHHCHTMETANLLIVSLQCSLSLQNNQTLLPASLHMCTTTIQYTTLSLHHYIPATQGNLLDYTSVLLQYTTV